MIQFLPASLGRESAWRNERALKDNHLVKCIQHTGEKKETTCWYFGDALSRSVISSNNYFTVWLSNFLWNLDYYSSYWHGEELYFNTLIFQVQNLQREFLCHLQCQHLLRQERAFLAALLFLPAAVTHPIDRMDFLITASVVLSGGYGFCK